MENLAKKGMRARAVRDELETKSSMRARAVRVMSLRQKVRVHYIK